MGYHYIYPSEWLKSKGFTIQCYRKLRANKSLYIVGVSIIGTTFFKN